MKIRYISTKRLSQVFGPQGPRCQGNKGPGEDGESVWSMRFQIYIVRTVYILLYRDALIVVFIREHKFTVIHELLKLLFVYIIDGNGDFL